MLVSFVCVLYISQLTLSSLLGGAMLTLHQSSPEDKDILLRVETEQARDQWVKSLTKASLDFITTKKKMEREKQEQREHVVLCTLCVNIAPTCACTDMQWAPHIKRTPQHKGYWMDILDTCR